MEQQTKSIPFPTDPAKFISNLQERIMKIKRSTQNSDLFCYQTSQHIEQNDESRITTFIYQELIDYQNNEPSVETMTILKNYIELYIDPSLIGFNEPLTWIHINCPCNDWIRIQQTDNYLYIIHFSTGQY